eukprot:762128-Prymnesium_polylepis.3
MPHVTGSYMITVASSTSRMIVRAGERRVEEKRVMVDVSGKRLIHQLIRDDARLSLERGGERLPGAGPCASSAVSVLVDVLEGLCHCLCCIAAILAWPVWPRVGVPRRGPVHHPGGCSVMVRPAGGIRERVLVHVQNRVGTVPREHPCRILQRGEVHCVCDVWRWLQRRPDRADAVLRQIVEPIERSRSLRLLANIVEAVPNAHPPVLVDEVAIHHADPRGAGRGGSD